MGRKVAAFRGDFVRLRRAVAARAALSPLVGVAVGAILGISGTLASTWVNHRYALDLDRATSFREERRHLYADFYSEGHALMTAVSKEDEVKALEGMDRALQGIELVGGLPVFLAANRAYDRCKIDRISRKLDGCQVEVWAFLDVARKDLGR